MNGKNGLILAVIAGAVYFSYPPGERISLGLDLRGGAHILMQVETGAALKYQMDLTQSHIGQRLKELGLSYDSIAPAGPTSLELRGTDPVRRSEVRQALDDLVGQWQIEDLGSGSFGATMPPDLRGYYETSAVDSTLTILRSRIDGLGIGEHVVQKQGVRGDRILVQLPGVEDPERIKDLLKDPALLEWKAVTYPPAVRDKANWMPPDSKQMLIEQFGGQVPADTELFPQRVAAPGKQGQELWWPLKRVSTVVGSDLRTAHRDVDEWGDPAVAFELTQEAGRRFETATRENLGQRMAIVLGSAQEKWVLSAPVIEGVIRDRGIIRRGFGVNDAEDLALKLRSGAIPTAISIIEERTVGPSLGQDSIRAGVVSGVMGFLGVLLFMVIYYRASGLNAVAALALNVLLVFGTLGALPFLAAGATNVRATLTLPGIAGLILTIGMAVDTNVLIFERIRDELRLGKTARSAVEQGFRLAFTTILDCHITTLVAAIFLFMYGTGPVRGYAVTLFIGLTCSMFTGVFVSRQLFELTLARKKSADSLSI
jgi:preprotein translocase subunit SecD